MNSEVSSRYVNVIENGTVLKLINRKSTFSPIEESLIILRYVNVIENGTVLKLINRKSTFSPIEESLIILVRW